MPVTTPRAAATTARAIPTHNVPTSKEGELGGL